MTKSKNCDRGTPVKKRTALQYALLFARNGLPVFPTSKNKKPLISKWPTSATTDEKTIRKWAERHKGCNFAVVTGHESGIVVVDVDRKNGKEGLQSLKRLLRKHSRLRKDGKWLTLATKTPSGGYHFYFQYPEDAHHIRTLGTIPDLPGIELKADGGCVTLPGSATEDGKRWELVGNHKPAAWLFPAWWEDGKEPISQVDVSRAWVEENFHVAGWSGDEAQVHCPLHQDEKPSCSMNVAKQVYNCFACAPKGTFRSLASKLSLPEPPTIEKPSKNLRLNIRRASDIEPEDLSWLWPCRIPLGKVTVIAGDPGDGKSLITLDIASKVSTGRSWPDGTISPIGSVIILSAEDDAADTIVPRLEAAGANTNKIHILESTTTIQTRGNEIETMFDIESDIKELENEIRQIGDVKLIIIDPISAYFGDRDTHLNSRVRAALSPLSKLANRNKVAVVAITHLSKSSDSKASYRILGSIAFIAAARAAWVTGHIENDGKSKLLFLPLKNNLARNEGGLEYEITVTPDGDPAITWGRPSFLPAEAVLSTKKKKKEPSQMEQAKEWLLEHLGRGAVESKKLLKMAKADGIATATLNRAKDELGVLSRRSGKGWRMKLPPATQSKEGTSR